MNGRKFLRPEYSSKIIGMIFIILASYLFLRTSYINAALGAAFIGIFTVLIVHLPTVEKDVSVAGLKSGVLSIHNLLQDLEMAEKGVIVNPHKNLTESRVYVPAGTFEKIPDLYDEMTIVSSGKGRVGVSLVPPGRPLLEEAKEKMEYSIEGKGIEIGRECMGHLSQGMNLAKSFSLRREEENLIKLRITLDRYADYCEDLRDTSEKICTRTGCPICSAYMTAASESLSSSLKIEDFQIEGEHIKYTLEEI